MRYYSFNSYIRRVTGGKRTNEPLFSKRLTRLQYREIGTSDWITHEGIAMLVPDTDRVVHTVELSNLKSDNIYEFRLPDYDTPTVYLTWRDDATTTMVVHWHTFQPHPLWNYTNGFSNNIHKFKTMPTTLNDSVKFAQVTDTHGRPGAILTIEDIAAQGDVRAIIHSGDMATSNGVDDGPDTWYLTFEALNKAIDSEGCIIPILPNIGNHEVHLGSVGKQWDNNNTVGVKPNFETHERGDVDWYYSFFPKFPGLQGYGVVDFGDYASVWQLDPGISTFIDQGQDTWLSDTLSERESVPHKLISMHYSPFPTGRRVMARSINETRATFCPIWEPYKPLVLVGHEHVWSVTVPILGGALDVNEAYEDPNGVVYIGSGPSQTNMDSRPGRNPHTKWWIQDSRASEWSYFYFEQPDYEVEMWKEERLPHEEDGTTFTNEEVCNYWLIELEPNKRTMTAIDGNKNVIHSFVQNV